MNLGDFAKQLVEKQHALILKDRRPWQPTATPATDLGYDCLRRIVYHRVRPLDAKEVGLELAGIFGEGDLHERDVRRKLDDLRVDLVENQRNFRDDKLEITGTVDGRVLVPQGEGEKPRRVPLEIKSTQAKPPENEQGWRETDSPLLKRYFAQLTVYMFLAGEPEALALFKDKGTGLWAVVPITLDYSFAEQLLQKAERVRDAVRAWKDALIDDDKNAALPARDITRGECWSCPWLEVCRPADEAIDPMLVAKDEQLARDIDQHQALKTGRDEYEKLHEKLKARFKLTRGERFVSGGWLITKRKHGQGTRLVIERLPMAPEAQLSPTGSD